MQMQRQSHSQSAPLATSGTRPAVTPYQVRPDGLGRPKLPLMAGMPKKCKCKVDPIRDPPRWGQVGRAQAVTPYQVGSDGLGRAQTAPEGEMKMESYCKGFFIYDPPRWGQVGRAQRSRPTVDRAGLAIQPCRSCLRLRGRDSRRCGLAIWAYDMRGAFPLRQDAGVVAELVAPDGQELPADPNAFERLRGKFRRASHLLRESRPLAVVRFFKQGDVRRQILQKTRRQLEFDKQRLVRRSVLEKSLGLGEQERGSSGSWQHELVVEFRQTFRHRDCLRRVADRPQVLAHQFHRQLFGIRPAVVGGRTGDFVHPVAFHRRRHLTDAGEKTDGPRAGREEVPALRAEAFDAVECVVMIANDFVVHILVWLRFTNDAQPTSSQARICHARIVPASEIFHAFR